MKSNVTPKPQTPTTAPNGDLNQRTVKTLAGSIYKHLQDEGCQPRDIISVSSQLLGLVTDELQQES